MPTNELEKFSKKIESGEVAASSNATIIESSKPAPDSIGTTSIIDDDEVVIAGMDTEVLKTEAASTAPVVTAVENEIMVLIEEHLKDFAKADPMKYPAERDKMVNDIIDYRRKLIIESGLTEEEATSAAKTRAIRSADKLNSTYAQPSEPGVAVVKIDKTQTDKVEFTDDEKEKMSKAKAIRLIEVEDSSLLSIPLKTSESDDVLFTAIHRASCNVSKYNMPMINTFDNCDFTGATTLQLVNAVYDENDSDYHRYQEQLELIYAKFQGSTTMDKYDIEGNTIMTKEDFAKWFRFFDMPVAMYAIYVASSTETITSTFKCDSCEKEYDFEYNTKKLISYDGIPEKFQADLDSVLKFSADRDGLVELKSNTRRGKRFKSQFTNNIYDISSPSVARALNVLRYVNPRDTYARYLSMYAMMFDSIYIYDKNDEKYIEIKSDKPRAILSYLYDIIDTELKLITKVVNDFYFIPTFRLTRKCPYCGNTEEMTFSIDDLVFLKAQSTEVEEIE